MKRVWVDFNDIEGEELEAVVESGPRTVAGETIVAYDEDGNECRAVVISDLIARSGFRFLTMRLDMSTFKQGEVSVESKQDGDEARDAGRGPDRVHGSDQG